MNWNLALVNRSANDKSSLAVWHEMATRLSFFMKLADSTSSGPPGGCWSAERLYFRFWLINALPQYELLGQALKRELPGA